MRCPLCRGRLADGFDPDHLDRMWEGIASAVDAPRLGPVERGLVRLGFPDHLARLMGATRSLRLSWFLAGGLALGFSVVAARLGDVVGVLALAPLVALAWGTVVGWTEWWSGVPLLAFRANGQVALAAVLLAAAAILIRRRDSFEQRRTA